jgi:predicted nucleic acid-binding protein
LIDTNLLVLLVAGNLDRSKVGSHRRLRQFDTFDLERVNKLAKAHAKHVSTPNILSEVSNHLNSGEQEIVAGAGDALSLYVGKLEEIYIPSRDLVKQAWFGRFGLADAAIIDAARDTGATVLTSEWALQGFLESIGLEAINIFNLKQSHEFR